MDSIDISTPPTQHNSICDIPIKEKEFDCSSANVEIKEEIPLPSQTENDNNDLEESKGVEISKELGCNFSKDLQNDFVTNTDSIGATRSEFYFETDHDALRGNPDYLTVLKTLAILEAQKVQAVKDLEILQDARNIAVKDPVTLISKLQNGENLNLPGKQKIAQLPYINWDKYGLASLSQLASYSIRKPETRRNVSALVSQVESNSESSAVGGNSMPIRDNQSSSSSTLPNITPHIHKVHQDLGPLESVNGLGCKVERTVDGKQYLVRGRLFDGKTKPKTFNQPWTNDEQKRLEELLHEYPSEDVEMERWKKIATSLGNRTAIQVQSRVQKYFLKLHKAGLPIPGKLGNKAKAKCKTSQNYNKFNGLLHYGGMNNGSSNSNKFVSNLVSQRNSSFFPHLKPEVKMSEDDEQRADMAIHYNTGTPLYMNGASSYSEEALNSNRDLINHNGINDDVMSDYTPTLSPLNNFQLTDDNYYLQKDDVSDEEGIPDEMKNTPEYDELIWLKRIRREKELEQREGMREPIKHFGYKCDGCGQDPILGGRFTCVDCAKKDHSVDFCCECAPRSSKLQNVGVDFGHDINHTIRPVRKRENSLGCMAKGIVGTMDKDYLIESRLGNYLDPNYQYFK